MTGAEDRQFGLARALQEFRQILASWCGDEEPDDDLDDLPVYEKDPP